MALDIKYGQIHVPGIPEDEPIFILRSQDKTAAGVIDYYADNAEEEGSPEELVKQADKSANVFREWQETHSDKVKLPD